MKKLFLCTLFCFFSFGSVQAQSKSELEKRYATFSGHKKFFDVEKWAMVKFHIVYKLTTAKIARDVEKLEDMKVKASSGAYGVLVGVSEQDLVAITNQVAENFINRMENEAGVEILTWSDLKDSPNTKKLQSKAQDREIYSRSQGLGYAISYDGTPVWNQVIQMVPGGRKLAKELGANNGMLTMYIDFADTGAEAEAFISKTSQGASWSYDGLGEWSSREYVQWKWGENYKNTILPIVRVRPHLGSQDVWEAATTIGCTSAGGQAANLYTFNMTYMGADPDALASWFPYADRVEKFSGVLPEVLKNRKNNKIEFASTFEVHTTPEKYGAAVMDATNRYFSDIIAYYNLSKPKKRK